MRASGSENVREFIEEVDLNSKNIFELQARRFTNTNQKQLRRRLRAQYESSDNREKIYDSNPRTTQETVTTSDHNDYSSPVPHYYSSTP
jgi:hypothetical protein